MDGSNLSGVSNTLDKDMLGPPTLQVSRNLSLNFNEVKNKVKKSYTYVCSWHNII
jgi:hypothetical protein